MGRRSAARRIYQICCYQPLQSRPRSAAVYQKSPCPLTIFPLHLPQAQLTQRANPFLLLTVRKPPPHTLFSHRTKKKMKFLIPPPTPLTKTRTPPDGKTPGSIAYPSPSLHFHHIGSRKLDSPPATEFFPSLKILSSLSSKPHRFKKLDIPPPARAIVTPLEFFVALVLRKNLCVLGRDWKGVFSPPSKRSERERKLFEKMMWKGSSGILPLTKKE